MDLETKQMIEKNRLGVIGAAITTSTVLLQSLLGLLQGVEFRMVLNCVVCVLIILFNVATYLKLKTQMVYRHCCCISMIVLYLYTMVSFQHQGMYALVFTIALMVMIYSDNRMTLLGAVLAVVGTVMRDIYLFSKKGIDMGNMVIQIIFILAYCLLSVMVTRLQNRQSEENMETVKRGADIQLQTSGKIVELAEQLNQKFEQAQGVSRSLNDTMQTSHTSVTEIAESTRLNAEAIEKQTMHTSDIQQEIQAVGQEAKAMGEISVRTKQAVEEGVALIDRLKTQAAEVVKINTDAKMTTNALNESIQDVQAITETILGISSQTNLLALNASIEAARAGEAGKGFAVVADEIRNLSEDTRKATEQISAIIEKLTRDAESAADSMTQSAEHAEKQNELIASTGDKLADIKEETDELYNGVVQVNESVEGIIEANKLIMDSITNLSATGEEVAASTDTALSISDSTIGALNNMNGLLNEISGISSQMEEVARN